MATNRKIIFQTTEDDDDAEQSSPYIFKSFDTFQDLLSNRSKEERKITSISSSVIEKQIESVIGLKKKLNKKCYSM